MYEQFGEELTLEQCLDILRSTEKSTVPLRAQSLFTQHEEEVQLALHEAKDELILEGIHFKVEYFARIVPVDKYRHSSMGWIEVKSKPSSWIGVNGSDPQGISSDQGIIGSSSNSDVRSDP